jgi:hypothetical protein
MSSLLMVVAIIPFAPAAYLLFQRILVGLSHHSTSLDHQHVLLSTTSLFKRVLSTNDNTLNHMTITSQLVAYLVLAILGHFATYSLIPKIKVKIISTFFLRKIDKFIYTFDLSLLSFKIYTLKRGIAGKDLGKRGTSIADKDM